MFGGADDAPAAVELPAGWERLDRAVRRASEAVVEWRRRATEAEDEVRRLRAALEAVTSPDAPGGATVDDAARLVAENALLRSRTDEARRRVAALLARLTILEAGR